MSAQTHEAARIADAASKALVPWSVLREQAEVMASSTMVAAQYRKKPNDVMAAALMGQELGWGIATAMRFIHVIEGKPSVSPEGMLALVRRAGHSVSGESTPQGATAIGRRADTGDEMTVSFTLDDARRANLDKKQVWKSYPQSMCWARAVAQLCRMLFPDVLLGAAYVPEEFDATVDEHGDVIDVEVLEGDWEAVTVLMAALDDLDSVTAEKLWGDFLARAGVADEDGRDLLAADEAWRTWLEGAIQHHKNSTGEVGGGASIDKTAPSDVAPAPVEEPEGETA